jgi:benzoyl-CoA reductase/2-hydroxyglutaryl-CoA dehydratase subunit BcrC/BadD/HgdB
MAESDIAFWTSPAIAPFADVVDTFIAQPESAPALLPGSKPIVGYVDAYFPVELALAAGAVPVRLRGDGHRPIEQADKYLDAGVNLRVRHLVDAIVTGRLDFVDLLCLTGGSSSLASMHAVFLGLADVEPELSPRRHYFLERGRAKFQAHRNFNRDRFAELAGFLSREFRREVTADRLEQAIAVSNDTRRLLRAVAELRSRPVPGLSGVDGAVIACASTLMDPTEFNAKLEEFLTSHEPPGALPSDAVRVFVSGSTLDHPELHEMIESIGGVVVGEDTELGAIWCRTDVSIGGDPMEALADHYTYASLDSWLLGIDARTSAKAAGAIETTPDVALFFHLQGDSAAGWDFPDQRAKLQRAGIPMHGFSDQPYAVRGDSRLRAALERWLESVRSAA